MTGIYHDYTWYIPRLLCFSSHWFFIRKGTMKLPPQVRTSMNRCVPGDSRRYPPKHVLLSSYIWQVYDRYMHVISLHLEYTRCMPWPISNVTGTEQAHKVLTGFTARLRPMSSYDRFKTYIFRHIPGIYLIYTRYTTFLTFWHFIFTWNLSPAHMTGINQGYTRHIPYLV